MSLVKCICYTVLFSYPNFLHSFKEATKCSQNLENPVVKYSGRMSYFLVNFQDNGLRLY